MTGTAKTEEEEFKKIYGLEVIQVPTNRQKIRNDMRGRRLQDGERQVQGRRRGDRQAP